MKNISMLINTADKRSHINPELYGHFSEHLGRCIYNGMYVGENSEIPNIKGVRKDVIEAFKEIKMPVLRWPGGCFADEYHWKDGIGEKSQRKKMINTNWGGVTEDNSFGTNEFFDLCEEIGCEPYLAGNLGSGTVQELSEWIEYITFDGVSPMADLRRKNGREKPWKLKYLGIGNENWGCGGSMRPEYYCDEYRRYQSFCKNFSGNELYKVACGPNSNDYNWTDVVMSNLGEWHTKAISLHYYTVPTGDWNKKGSATEFSDEEYYETISKTLYMDELIKRHSEIMSRRDPEGKIGLIVDEWGCWYDVEEGTNPGFLYQQNTMRDALVAGMTLNIFNKHSDRVKMACIAQLINVLQSVMLTDGDKMIKTPTYYVFHMMRHHQGAALLDSSLVGGATVGSGKNELPKVFESVSEDKDGVITVTLTNNSLESSEDVDIMLTNEGDKYSVSEARYIEGAMDAHNTFEAPEVVDEKDFTAYENTQTGVKVTLPACSVVTLRLSK